MKIVAIHILALGLSGVLALTGCRREPQLADDAAGKAATTAPAGAAVHEVPVITEVFQTAMTPEDNIDSPAAWVAPDGAIWVIGTAKATDKLVVYDGRDGRTLRDVGSSGTGKGQFERPNGIAVIDDLLFVVERDNHRVQVLRLPGFEPVLTFAEGDLVKPYGLWINKLAGGYEVYVTDSYHDGEDAQVLLQSVDIVQAR